MFWAEWRGGTTSWEYTPEEGEPGLVCLVPWCAVGGRSAGRRTTDCRVPVKAANARHLERLVSEVVVEVILWSLYSFSFFFIYLAFFLVLFYQKKTFSRHVVLRPAAACALMMSVWGTRFFARRIHAGPASCSCTLASAHWSTTQSRQYPGQPGEASSQKQLEKLQACLIVGHVLSSAFELSSISRGGGVGMCASRTHGAILGRGRLWWRPRN